MMRAIWEALNYLNSQVIMRLKPPYGVSQTADESPTVEAAKEKTFLDKEIEMIMMEISEQKKLEKELKEMEEEIK